MAQADVPAFLLQAAASVLLCAVLQAALATGHMRCFHGRHGFRAPEIRACGSHAAEQHPPVPPLPKRASYPPYPHDIRLLTRTHPSPVNAQDERVTQMGGWPMKWTAHSPLAPVLAMMMNFTSTGPPAAPLQTGQPPSPCWRDHTCSPIFLACKCAPDRCTGWNAPPPN